MTGPQPEAVRGDDPAHGPGARWNRTPGTDWLTDYFAKNMPGGIEAWAAQFDAEPVVAREHVVPEGGYLVPPALAEDLAGIVKLSAVIRVPDELLDESREYAKPSRRARLRYRIAGWRLSLACLAYRIIAGYWPRDGWED